MAAIDIGSPATNRGTDIQANYTLINKDNPADATGTITSVEIWAHTALTDCEVATFFVVSGDNLTTRDTHAIGNVTAGSKQTFSGLSITVEAGDYIGMYYLTGKMDRDSTGYVGVWYSINDNIPCTNHGFATMDTQTLSLYGTGETTGAEEANAIFIGTNF